MNIRPAVQPITEELIDLVAGEARQSARRRSNYNFHAGGQENPQRFLNVILEGSYVRPHRHLTPPKAESFLVLNGHAVVFVFDDDGVVTSGHILGPGAYQGKTAARGIDLAPGLWHSIAALTPVVVCYEVKPGPWDPLTDKEFAPWAPEEGSAAAAEYLAALLG
jgi:cupin fold WbuC family metalloprotein